MGSGERGSPWNCCTPGQVHWCKWMIPHSAFCGISIISGVQWWRGPLLHTYGLVSPIVGIATSQEGDNPFTCINFGTSSGLHGTKCRSVV